MGSWKRGRLLIEISGIYDGWSVEKLEDGTMVNRWPESDRRHAPTQQWIERQLAAERIAEEAKARQALAGGGE